MIAVIIPVYNGADTIVKSIRSLLAQTNKNWLSIIINDGSDDSTANILLTFAADSRFRIISLPKNRGRGAARNIGLREALASGATYMCMLDADDEYRVDKLEIQAAFMNANPHITLCSSGIGLVNDRGMYRVLDSAATQKELRYSDYYRMVPVPHASSIIRLSEVSVEFNESMRYSEDQDFMRRLLYKKSYYFMPEILYYYYRDASFSADKYKQSLVATYESLGRLDIARKRLIKLRIISFLKWLSYRVLETFRAEHIYFNRIGRLPTDHEVQVFKDNERLLHERV